MSKLLLTILFLVSLTFIVYFGYEAAISKFISSPVYRIPGNIKFVPISNQGDEVIEVAPSKALLPGTKWVPQTFNNCVPATTSMVLQYFNHSVSQEQTKAALRTNPDDKNVFTYEMADYLKGYGIQSKIFYNGDLNTVKLLISNGFYVVVENWLHPNEDIGHVTILRGFDDEKGVLIADDSYLGVNIVYKYQEFEAAQWKAFNREFMPIYLASQENKLKSIIGPNWETEVMYQNAVSKAISEIAVNDRDMEAYFNLGTSYFGLGDYQKAEAAFAKSQNLVWPRRMLWYQIQPVQTLNNLGQYQEALRMADLGLVANDSFSELHLEKARSYIGLNQTDQAKAELTTTLKYSPNLQAAKTLLESLK